MRYGDSYTDGKIEEQDIVKFVNARKQQGIDAYGRYWRKTRSWYNVFRGIVTGNIGSWRNDVHIPILFGQIMAYVTQMCQHIFADREVIQFVAGDPSQAATAKKLSNLVNLQLEDSEAYLKAVDFFLSAGIYGTGFARTTWKLTSRPRLYRTRVLDQEMVVKDFHTTFDGPDFEVLDILDAIPEPGKTRLRDCDWFIHTYYIDLDNLLELQYEQNDPMFDPGAIKRLLEVPMGERQLDAWKLRTTTYRNATDFTARAQQSMAKPVLITEYWGKVPSEFAINGDRNVVITVANDKVVLRYEPNPFWHGRLPFLMYTPMPDMHALHGTGKCEIGEKIQATVNKLAAIKLDSLEIFGQPMFFVSNTSGLDTQQLISRPGKLFQVQGDKVSDAVMPVSPDVRVLQMLYTEIDQLSKFGQHGIGIPSDVVEGVDPADRETARGFLSRKESAMGRIGGEAVLAERMFIIPLVQDYAENNQQFLTLPKQIKMIGGDALIDPDSGLPIPQPPQQITLDDVSAQFSCRALGASRLMSKSILAQQLTTYMQVAASNPAMMALTNWVNFTRTYAKSMNLDPNELLIQQAQSGGVPLLNQIAAGSGGMGAGDMINAQMGLQGTGPAGNTPYLGGNTDAINQP